MRVLRLISLALGALLIAPATGLAAERTLVFKTSPIRIPGYDVAKAVIVVPSPKTSGYIVGMSVDVVDRRGRELTRSHVMLHHAVFHNKNARDYTCSDLDWPDRFYASSEELWRLDLPRGYGYPNRGNDTWGLYYMLMSHQNHPSTVYVRYKVRYATGVRLKPVRPVWLDVRNCKEDPQFSVPGTGGRGSTFSKASDFRMPSSGRLVFGFGHVHGGGLRLELDNATCRRRLFTSLPTWNGVNPRPYLHEPGPGHMSRFRTTVGLPVAAAQTLRLRAVYDNSLAGTRVMGIMLAYLAPGRVTGCPPKPKLARDPQSKPARPSRLVVPLLRQPRGPESRNIRSTSVRDYRFADEKVVVPAGTTFRWRFEGAIEHDVTVANGPVGFASDYTRGGTFTQRFTRPGVYNIMCSLHPSRMSMRVTVRPKSGRLTAGAAEPTAGSLVGGFLGFLRELLRGVLG